MSDRCSTGAPVLQCADVTMPAHFALTPDERREEMQIAIPLAYKRLPDGAKQDAHFTFQLLVILQKLFDGHFVDQGAPIITITDIARTVVVVILTLNAHHTHAEAIYHLCASDNRKKSSVAGLARAGLVMAQDMPSGVDLAKMFSPYEPEDLLALARDNLFRCRERRQHSYITCPPAQPQGQAPLAMHFMPSYVLGVLFGFHLHDGPAALTYQLHDAAYAPALPIMYNEHYPDDIKRRVDGAHLTGPCIYNNIRTDIDASLLGERIVHPQPDTFWEDRSFVLTHQVERSYGKWRELGDTVNMSDAFIDNHNSKVSITEQLHALHILLNLCVLEQTMYHTPRRRVGPSVALKRTNSTSSGTCDINDTGQDSTRSSFSQESDMTSSSSTATTSVDGQGNSRNRFGHYKVNVRRGGRWRRRSTKTVGGLATFQSRFVLTRDSALLSFGAMQVTTHSATSRDGPLDWVASSGIDPKGWMPRMSAILMQLPIADESNRKASASNTRASNTFVLPPLWELLGTPLFEDDDVPFDGSWPKPSEHPLPLSMIISVIATHTMVSLAMSSRLLDLETLKTSDVMRRTMEKYGLTPTVHGDAMALGTFATVMLFFCFDLLSPCTPIGEHMSKFIQDKLEEDKDDEDDSTSLQQLCGYMCTALYQLIHDESEEGHIRMSIDNVEVAPWNVELALVHLLPTIEWDVADKVTSHVIYRLIQHLPMAPNSDGTDDGRLAQFIPDAHGQRSTVPPNNRLVDMRYAQLRLLKMIQEQEQEQEQDDDVVHEEPPTIVPRRVNDSMIAHLLAGIADGGFEVRGRVTKSRRGSRNIPDVQRPVRVIENGSVVVVPKRDTPRDRGDAILDNVPAIIETLMAMDGARTITHDD